MSGADIAALRRAHALFEADPATPAPAFPPARLSDMDAPGAGATVAAHRGASSTALAHLRAARDLDTRLAAVFVEAYRDHASARRDTGAVLAAARADAHTVPDNPIAARELLRRRAMRLRAQHRHVRTARLRAGRHRAALRGLHYRPYRGPAGDRRAQTAVRSALSRIGRPYVWGATGPDRFDCSGLVQWAYAQAGIRLHRTTFEQIHDGVPVSRSQVQPGDLVFPHAGHVQLAIGGGMVVEAPQPGSVVQISRMGSGVAIRRPV